MRACRAHVSVPLRPRSAPGPTGRGEAVGRAVEPITGLFLSASGFPEAPLVCKYLNIRERQVEPQRTVSIFLRVC